jgi:hypothetical protein
MTNGKNFDPTILGDNFVKDAIVTQYQLPNFALYFAGKLRAAPRQCLRLSRSEQDFVSQAIRGARIIRGDVLPDL